MFTDLSAEFPRESVSWRAQSVTKDGAKAMALAYIDARDVMERLDQVCGPAGWSDSYVETAKGRVICSIAIKTEEGWISKSDGAGDTAVEGDKGGISDAFKRAAVKWGIGRYLYDMPTPWVPCESSDWNGKKQWKAWKQSPWNFVNRPDAADEQTFITDEQRDQLVVMVTAAGLTIQAVCERYGIENLKQLHADMFERAIKSLKMAADRAKQPEKAAA
jgi:hypothetical protein